jgi:hypothetical protein
MLRAVKGTAAASPGASHEKYSQAQTNPDRADHCDIKDHSLIPERER